MRLSAIAAGFLVLLASQLLEARARLGDELDAPCARARARAAPGGARSSTRSAEATPAVDLSGLALILLGVELGGVELVGVEVQAQQASSCTARRAGRSSVSRSSRWR